MNENEKDYAWSRYHYSGKPQGWGLGMEEIRKRNRERLIAWELIGAGDVEPYFYYLGPPKDGWMSVQATLSDRAVIYSAAECVAAEQRLKEKGWLESK